MKPWALESPVEAASYRKALGYRPRVGIAWSPRRFHHKIVVRSGLDLDDDGGELFTYLSPGFASGVLQAFFAETLQATSLQ